MTQSLPVSIKTVVWQNRGTKIYYPQIIGMNHHKMMKKLNKIMEDAVRSLVHEQHEKQGFNYFDQMVGMYEIKTNERNVLSVSLTNYAIAYHAANGLTLMTSLTFDLETGELKDLRSLFKPGSNYVKILSTMVKEQIKKRDIPTLEPFKSISPNQEFYVADKLLVLYFQEIEITPHYFGIPMFPIPLYEIEDMIRPNSVLERLLA